MKGNCYLNGTKGYSFVFTLCYYAILMFCKKQNPKTKTTSTLNENILWILIGSTESLIYSGLVFNLDFWGWRTTNIVGSTWEIEEFVFCRNRMCDFSNLELSVYVLLLRNWVVIGIIHSCIDRKPLEGQDWYEGLKVIDIYFELLRKQARLLSLL